MVRWSFSPACFSALRNIVSASAGSPEMSCRMAANVRRRASSGCCCKATSRAAPTVSSCPLAASARQSNSALWTSRQSGRSSLMVPLSNSRAVATSPDSRHTSARGTTASARLSKSSMPSNAMRASAGRLSRRSSKPLLKSASGCVGASRRTSVRSSIASSVVPRRARAPARATSASWRRAFNWVDRSSSTAVVISATASFNRATDSSE